MVGGGAINIDLPMIQVKTSSPSSSSSSCSKFPVAVNKSVPLRQSCTAACSRCSLGSCSKIDCVLGKEDKRPGGSLFDVVLGQVPSRFEVENAIAALQEALASHGYGRVLDAFRWLQTDSPVKRLVISLSTDKAVWSAIMNNEMVRKLWEPCLVNNEMVRNLWEPCNTAGNCRLLNYDEDPDMVRSMLKWAVDVIRHKIAELIQQFQLLTNQVFQPPGGEKPTKETRDEVDDKVRSPLLLSIVIILIVVVARAHACAIFHVYRRLQ